MCHGSVSPAGLGGTVEADLVCPDPSGAGVELVAFPVASLRPGLLMKSVLRTELWIDRHIRRPQAVRSTSTESRTGAPGVAQVVIFSGSWDRAPNRVLRSVGSLLEDWPPLLAPRFTLSQRNKNLLKK